MNRVILKVSGEYLKGEQNVSNDKLLVILNIVKLLKEKKKKVAIVIGGGNFFRGRENTHMDAVTGDTIGMIASVMNSLYLKDFFKQNNIDSYIRTPFTFPNLIDNYTNDELKKLYNNDNVVIFGGGIGKSGYSTDSAVIDATKILGGEMIIKLTNVKGVYDSDPKTNKNARLYTNLDYKFVLDNHLKVMDEYAIAECMKLNIKIKVMDINDYRDILKDEVGTIIGG